MGNNGNGSSIKTTEWGILCLEHKQNYLDLELLNVMNDTAHRLVFSASGTDDIEFKSTWLKGKYYKRFQTQYPATFSDFHEKFIFLTPEPKSIAINHIMTIGMLAKIKIPQSVSSSAGNWYMMGFSKVIFGDGKRTKPQLFQTPEYATPIY